MLGDDDRQCAGNHFALEGCCAHGLAIHVKPNGLVGFNLDASALEESVARVTDVQAGDDARCSANRAGVDMAHVRAVVLTHRHADHLYGLPMLVQGLWLSGRETALPIYGPAEALSVARELLELFDLVERPDMFILEWF